MKIKRYYSQDRRRNEINSTAERVQEVDPCSSARREKKKKKRNAAAHHFSSQVTKLFQNLHHRISPSGGTTEMYRLVLFCN